ncbi:MAG TPA: ATP-binding protein [Ktedonobacterales bacterium]|nr:ATP-binding protein [Ktedonobacterales bacterium]
MPMDGHANIRRERESARSPSAEEHRLLLRTPIAALIEAYPDAVFLYDRAGQIVTLNTLAQRLFGLGRDDQFDALPYTERLSLLAPRALDGRPLGKDDWYITRILSGEVVPEGASSVARIHGLDGRERVLAYSGAPIRDDEGAIVGGFAIIRDLTEQQRLSEEARTAKEEAQARAAQLEAILDAITDGIYVYDGDASLVRTNSAAQHLNPGTAQETYRARSFEERISEMRIWDDQGMPVRAEDEPVRRVLRGEVLTGSRAVDSLVRFPDGRLAQVNTTGAPVLDATGAVTGGVIVTRDVTEHRQLERRTRDSLDALLAMARAAVGAPEEPATDDTDDGATTAIRELAELTRRVIASERVAIISLDDDDHIVPVAVAGISAEEAAQWMAMLRGVPLALFLPAELVARLRAGEVFTIDTTPEPRRDTSFGTTSALLAPMTIGDRLIGTLSLDFGAHLHDIPTEVEALANAVAQLAALVLERDRLMRDRAAAEARVLALTETTRRMDEFLGVVSHELRTPLTVVSVSLQLAARRIQRLLDIYSERGARDAEIRGELLALNAVVDRALGSAARQSRLVMDLLDVSRIKAGKLDLRPTRCDLRAIAAEAIADATTNEPERAIIFEQPETPVIVLADPDRIGQVITNFVGNALKYSAPETPVAVTVEALGHTARLSARDEGPGLPASERERVWELFYRVPEIEVRSGSGVGLGLGLHISKTLVERHGGEVGVASEPGEGATFWFTLPLAQ